MQLIRPNSWELVSSFRRDINRLLQAQGPESFVPGVDIQEEVERFVVLVDLPGIDPAAVEITVDSDLLTIKGRRESAPVADGAAVQRAERPHGPFERRFRLPQTAGRDGYEADYRNGVLTVSIPKASEALPYRIEVTAN